MRIAIVGLGAVGARVARQLLSTDEVDEIVVRDSRDDRLDAVVASLGGGGNVLPERAPHAGPPEADVVVLATPAGGHAPTARDALAAGSSVVSVSDAIGDVRALLDLDPEARERGSNVVIGAGFAPGLTCLLAAHAAHLLDGVDEIHVARTGTGGPACARQHHDALGAAAIDWRDGGWVERPGGSGRELCWFPDPIGAEDCYRAALPDALLLQPAFPGVARVTARVAAKRRDRLTARLPMMRPPHPEGGPGAVRVEVRGRCAGDARETHVLGAMDRPAVACGAVAAVAAVWCASGRMARPGAAGLAVLVDARPFLVELRRRGVRTAIFEGAAAATAA